MNVVVVVFTCHLWQFISIESMLFCYFKVRKLTFSDRLPYYAALVCNNYQAVCWYWIMTSVSHCKMMQYAFHRESMNQKEFQALINITVSTGWHPTGKSNSNYTQTLVDWTHPGVWKGGWLKINSKRLPFSQMNSLLNSPSNSWLI